MNTNCPLCKAKNVITETPFVSNTVANTSSPLNRPFLGQRGGSPSLGNYHTESSGGEVDYKTHALTCVHLQFVKEKIGVLRYHVEKEEMDHLLVDSNTRRTLENYQARLKELGFYLGYDVLLTSKPRVYVKHIQSKKIVLVVSVKRPNNGWRAWELLRHRMLCGETFDVPKVGMCQFDISDKTIDFKVLVPV